MANVFLLWELESCKKLNKHLFQFFYSYSDGTFCRGKKNVCTYILRHASSKNTIKMYMGHQESLLNVMLTNQPQKSGKRHPRAGPACAMVTPTAEPPLPRPCTSCSYSITQAGQANSQVGVPAVLSFRAERLSSTLALASKTNL